MLPPRATWRYDSGEPAGSFPSPAAMIDRLISFLKSLPDAGYGQGQVVTSPFQMARVAATVASGGMAPLGRWILDETNPRVQEPQPVISPGSATLR